MLIFAIVIAALIVIFAFWVISAQRSLIGLDELCGNALSQIGVQQNSRWDALTALADLTKQYSAHEYKTLMSVIGERKTINSNSTAQETQEQENMITQAMGRLLAVAEAYPDLKANQTYLDTMGSVRQYEDNVRRSRMVYNDTVTKFNKSVRQIPTNLIAGILGFKKRDYLETPDSKSDMPSMS
ncbi:MAG: LemA family protein [Oscillospiraceae bacterium]|jgi:LemA protein|nr:LemA family protein [Oscillospiraceae bacterium]